MEYGNISKGGVKYLGLPSGIPSAPSPWTAEMAAKVSAGQHLEAKSTAVGGRKLAWAPQGARWRAKIGFRRSQPESLDAKNPSWTLQDPRLSSKVSPTWSNLGPTGDNLAPCWSEFHAFFSDFWILILEWPKSRIYCKIHIETRFFHVRNGSKTTKNRSRKHFFEARGSKTRSRKHFLAARRPKTDFWRSKTPSWRSKMGFG